MIPMKRMLLPIVAYVLNLPLLASIAVILGHKAYNVGSLDSTIAKWTIPTATLSAVLWGVLASRSQSSAQRICSVVFLVATVIGAVWVYRAGVVVF